LGLLVSLISVFLYGALILCFFNLSSQAQAYESERVLLEGKKLPLEKLFRDDSNTLFVPLDLFCSNTDTAFKINSLSKIIIITSKNINVKLQVQNNLAIVNEKWNYMKAPVQNVDNQIIVPLFDLAEYFGFKAEYRGFTPAEKDNTEKLFGFPPSQDSPAVEPADNSSGPGAFNKASDNAGPEILDNTGPEILEGGPGDYRNSRPVYKNSGMPPDSYEARMMPDSRDQMIPASKDSVAVNTHSREDRRQKYFTRKRRKKPERPDWSMKGKVGLGLNLGGYRPDGGDLENDIESHLIWGGKFSLGISNHWSIETLFEDWEDSADNHRYAQLPLAGSGSLTIQPLTFSLKCRFMANSRFKPYLGLGYTRFNVGFSFTDNASVNYSEKDTCWGPSVMMGGEYFINRHVSLSGDFRYHWARIGFDITSLSNFIEVRMQDFMFSGGLNFWFR
jgi:hypothetical protein